MALPRQRIPRYDTDKGINALQRADYFTVPYGMVNILLGEPEYQCPRRADVFSIGAKIVITGETRNKCQCPTAG